MKSMNFNCRDIRVYTLNGEEQTEDILALCEEMKNGKYVDLDGILYQFAYLPEFLASVNSKCNIDLETIYNTYLSDIRDIGVARTQILSFIDNLSAANAK